MVVYVGKSLRQFGQGVIDILETKKGNKVLYIYGEIDPWTACGYHPSKSTNALRMDKKGGSHLTRIASFEGEELKKIYKYIKKHAKVKPRSLK